MNNMVPCSWDVLKHPDLWAVLVKLRWHGFVYCTSCQDVPCSSATGRQTLHTLLLSGQSLHDHTYAEFVACACHNLKCNYSRPFLNSAVGDPLLLWEPRWYTVLFSIFSVKDSLDKLRWVKCQVLHTFMMFFWNAQVHKACPSARCSRYSCKRHRNSCQAMLCTFSSQLWPVGEMKMDKFWLETWLFSSSHLRGSGVWAMLWHHWYSVL